MKGIELSERFYYDVVKKLILENFPQLENRFSAGLIGYGSDVLGNDDKASRDHEWGPRCQLWFSDQDYERYGVELNIMLQNNLPELFLGFHTRFLLDMKHGVLKPAKNIEGSFHHIAITTIKRHLLFQYGIKQEGNLHDEVQLSHIDWLCIPEQKLLELTRGKIFEDALGNISSIRTYLEYYPDEIWLYKMRYCWVEIQKIELISICYSRGEVISGQIQMNRIIEQLIRLVYLYNRRYYPGYIKWFTYEMNPLPLFGQSIRRKLINCYHETNIDKIIGCLKEIILDLVELHNSLALTRNVEIRNQKSLRGLVDFSVWDIVEAIEEKIPNEFKEFKVKGSIDQWVTNSDILVWSDNFTKFSEVYLNQNILHRDGVGDFIV